MATRRGNVLDPELTRLVQQVVRQFLNSFQPRPRSEKKRRGGGSSGDSNTTRYAQVTVQADANGDSIGKCVLLSEDDMSPMNVSGAALILNPSDPEYDSDAVTDAELEFKSGDYVDHEVDDRVILMTGRAEPGTEWDENKVWAHRVEYPTTAEELECETLEVVTDVECVDGDIVVTTENIEYVSGPCP